MTAKTEKRPFNLLTCPLDGSNLLEAGAGTGKTFSLAFLYLRLLLERGLMVEEILVTTFTNAATAELNGRIFAQIQQAQQCFDGICEGHDDEALATQFAADSLLLDLLRQLRQIHDDKHIALRLRLALARFDQANIASINGFALRLLRENADVLNTYAPEEILDDDSEFVKAAYLALARDNFATLDNAADIGAVVAAMNSADLLGLLTNMLANRKAIASAEPDVTDIIEKLAPMLAAAKNSNHAEAIALIASAIERKQLNGRSYPQKKLAEMSTRIADETAFFDPKFLTFFSQQNLLTKRNKNATATFDHPFFMCCDDLLAVAEQLPLLQYQEKFSALLALTDTLAPRVAELKAERMALTHDDIVRLAANGAAHIHTPIKAALIDEAQDTNAHQMALFRELFLQRADNVSFFVGDPKQAIYGFRGANVFSFLEIKGMVERYYVMDTNYRSTEALNASVNTFFGGKKPFGTDIDYHPIGWKKANTRSDFGDKSLSLLTAESGSKDGLAVTAAAAIAALLQQQPRINHEEPQQGTPLQPADIAVLVRSASQAEAVKAALAAQGLAASYTGKVSVYESNEAQWLWMLLTTIHHGDSRRVKALMLTPLLTHSLTDAHDEQVVATLCADLQPFAQLYQSSGFSVMFHQLLKTYHIAGNLLQSDDGKRRLSNFVQLFELLQHVLQRQSLSLSGLCDLLAGQIHDAEKASELRLEDDQAVTIMTMHSAKGLEFPVVCLPFFEYDSPRRASATDLLISHQQQKTLPAFIKTPELAKRCANEETSEAMRLAYVALTRAEYHNIIVRQPDGSKAYRKTSMLTALVETLPSETNITQAGFVAEPMDLSSTTNPTAATAPLTYTGKTLEKTLHSAWQLSSFSRLQQLAESQAESHATVVTEHAPEATENAIISGALAAYPPGPRPGSALHEMYEHYMQHRQNDTAFITAIDRAVKKYLYAEDQANWPDSDALAAAVAESAAIALAPNAFCLNDISVQQQSIEMQFFMHLPPQARQQLLAAFSQSPADLQRVTPVIPDENIVPTDGYVHGFIDYWFAHDGKYYVLDYKSNRLGSHYVDYQHAAMHAEMQHHRYDLQAVIYTIALCKHLFIKTKESYDAQIGGYYYLFVRGMRHGSDSGIYHDKVDWNVVSRFL